MKCNDILLEDYVEGFLNTAEKSVLETHLSSCNKCQQTLENLRTEQRLLACTLNETQLKSSLTENLMEEIKQHKQIKARRHHYKMMFITAAIIMISFTLIATMNQPSQHANVLLSDTSKNNEDGKVTEEEYKQIKFGMTSEEVFTIIGSKGTVVSKSGADGDPHNTSIYKFDTAGHSPGAEMTFEGDKLSYKAQIGLETTEIEINLEQLNQLEKGMPKENVFEILGGKGALVAESEVLEIYSYNNPTSDAEITVLFIDGKFKSSGELKGSM